ncbi:MAG TPA: hypothetical protein VIG88_13275 [Lysobacter sp.]
MPLRTVLLAAGTFSALAATSLVAGNRTAPAPLVAKPVAAAAQARLEAREQIDDAVAAAVIGSISRQFDAEDVVVQLGRVAILPASIQDRQVSGNGRLQIGGDGEWIPFRFDATYDTASAEVTYPQLTLGGEDASTVATGSPLAASLGRQVAAALRSEFQNQPVRWTAGDVQAASIGRYVRVQGQGIADFGDEGATPAQVQGLYDSVARRWIRVHYELGPTATDAVATL